jgi:hypothetical protein
MKAKQLYFVLIAVLVLLLAGFFGVAYGANKLMGGQASKLSKLRADSDVLQTLQITLNKNKQDVTRYGSLNSIAETVVPQDKDQAEAVREIVNLAAQSGISKVSSITFPTSTLGSIGTGTVINPNLTQLLPVTGIPGVYELQITITQTSTDEVGYDQFISFLTKLEQNRRTAQVSSITVQPDTQKPGQVSFNLVINEFIKP